MKLQNLIDTAKGLIQKDIAPDCWSDDRTQRTGHWSGTKEEMEADLGRPLNPEEIQVLCLSRFYGPLNPQNFKTAEAIWPNGNQSGAYFSWEELIAELEALA